MAKIEPVSTKPPQSDGQQHGGVPAVALGPVALPPFTEHLLAQAKGVLLHTAVGNVPMGFATWGSYTSAPYTRENKYVYSLEICLLHI